MSYMKRRIAVFLCMVMAFTAVFWVLPQEQAQAAAKVTLSWDFGNYSSKVKEAEIELGAENLYIGDYVSAYASGKTYTNYGYLSANSGVTYKSSNKNIIAVDSKGKLTAKKIGTATITIKFKGVTGKCKLTVVESFASIRDAVSGYEAGKKASEELVSAYGKGITSKNCYKVLKAYKVYKNSYVSAVGYGSDGKSCLYTPIAGRAGVIASEVQKYGETRNPLATSSGKCFKVKSITGKGTSITITLKSKVTADQLLGIQFAGVYYDEVSDGKTSTVTFPMYVIDKKGKYTAVSAKVKKGSNKITIKTPKLTKGQTYSLGSGIGDWLISGSGNKNSFKAK